MPEAFDPYHKWLGIPPDEQPADHYRLLGIQRFEADQDVIAHAADRQMAHLRTMQAGKHSAESQKLLNELAAARVRLLDPAKKAAYDRELRARVCPAPPPMAPTAAPPPVAWPVDDALDFAAEITPRTESGSRRRRRGPPAWLVVEGMGAVVLAIAVCVALWRSGRLGFLAGEEKRPASSAKASAERPRAKPAPSKEQPAETKPAEKPPELPPPKPQSSDPAAVLLAKIREAIEDDRTTASAPVGGSGGSSFEDVPTDTGLLIGANVTVGGWAGHTVIKAIQPIFSTLDGTVTGARHGVAGGKTTRIEAKPGYAVGGLNVKGGLRVDGLEFVFMRIKEDGLDKNDSYTSPWLGGQGGGEATTLGGEGSPVVGLAGRGGSDLDAIGVVSAAMSP